MLSVKLATEADMPRLMELLRAMHAEIGIGALNAPKVFHLVSRLLRDGAVLVAVEDNLIIGAIGLELRAWWYSDDTVLGDYFFFVDAEHRGSEAAVRLIERASEFAHQAGRPLMLGVLSLVETERKNLFFRRRFPTFKPCGELFIEGA
jgi:GNAT superfamily N-acetyltransferase